MRLGETLVRVVIMIIFAILTAVLLYFFVVRKP
jgi:hypothetical protein